MALHRAGRSAIERMVHERTNIRHGSVSGRTVDATAGYGLLPQEHVPSFREAVYAIFSYQTPIAWLDGAGNWTVPDKRYSVTTANHISNVRFALDTCARCKRFFEPAPTIGTGYAILPDGSRVCYSCADDMQRDEMRTADRFTAYVSGDERAVMTWSGGRLGTVTDIHRSERARKTYVRVTDVHGARWHGVGPAESGTYVNLRRSK